MSRWLGASCLAIVSLSARLPAAAEPHAALAALNTPILVLTSSSSPNWADGQVIESTIVMLSQTSPTFQDLLAVLKASPHVRVFISPSVQVRLVHGLIGRTRFVFGPDQVVAMVEVYVDPSSPRLRAEAVAHELAHVAEVACLERFETEAGVRRQLWRRASSIARSRANAMLETEFAIEVGRQVSREARSKTPSASQFARLAAIGRLATCP